MEAKLIPPTFIKVDRVEPARHCFNIFAKVHEARHAVKEGFNGPTKYVEGVLGDETASVNFKFFGDNYSWVNTGKIIAVRNGLSTVIEEHIVIEIDRFGKITEEKDRSIEKVNLANNLSKPAYVKKVDKRTN